MTIDPGSSTPIYEQIAVAMRAAIAAGTYGPGEMLPSIRALALELLVNPTTVKHAYDELEREGLVQAVRGRGMEVTRRSQAPARLRSRASVQAAFAEGFDVATSAGMPVEEVDELYDSVRRHQARRTGAGRAPRTQEETRP